MPLNPTQRRVTFETIEDGTTFLHRYKAKNPYVLGPLPPFLEGFVAFFGGIRTQGSLALHAPREVGDYDLFGA
jgi:hypothetical protein